MEQRRNNIFGIIEWEPGTLETRLDEAHIAAQISDVKKIRGTQFTPFLYAIFKEVSVAALEKLLALGADCNDVDGRGLTALHHAVWVGSPQLTRFILNDCRVREIPTPQSNELPSDIANRKANVAVCNVLDAYSLNLQRMCRAAFHKHKMSASAVQQEYPYYPQDLLIFLNNGNPFPGMIFYARMKKLRPTPDDAMITIMALEEVLSCASHEFLQKYNPHQITFEQALQFPQRVWSLYNRLESTGEYRELTSKSSKAVIMTYENFFRPLYQASEASVPIFPALVDAIAELKSLASIHDHYDALGKQASYGERCLLQRIKRVVEVFERIGVNQHLFERNVCALPRAYVCTLETLVAVVEDEEAYARASACKTLERKHRGSQPENAEAYVSYYDGNETACDATPTIPEHVVVNMEAEVASNCVNSGGNNEKDNHDDDDDDDEKEEEEEEEEEEGGDELLQSRHNDVRRGVEESSAEEELVGQYLPSVPLPGEGHPFTEPSPQDGLSDAARRSIKLCKALATHRCVVTLLPGEMLVLDYDITTKLMPMSVQLIIGGADDADPPAVVIEAAMRSRQGEAALTGETKCSLYRTSWRPLMKVGGKRSFLLKGYFPFVEHGKIHRYECQVKKGKASVTALSRKDQAGSEKSMQNVRSSTPGQAPPPLPPPPPTTAALLSQPLQHALLNDFVIPSVHDGDADAGVVDTPTLRPSEIGHADEGSEESAAVQQPGTLPNSSSSSSSQGGERESDAATTQTKRVLLVSPGTGKADSSVGSCASVDEAFAKIEDQPPAPWDPPRRRDLDAPPRSRRMQAMLDPTHKDYIPRMDKDKEVSWFSVSAPVSEKIRCIASGTRTLRIRSLEQHGPVYIRYCDVFGSVSFAARKENMEL